MIFSIFFDFELKVKHLLFFCIINFSAFAQEFIGADLSFTPPNDFFIAGTGRIQITLNLYVNGSPSGRTEETVIIYRKSDNKLMNKFALPRINQSQLLDYSNPKCADKNGVRVYHEVYQTLFFFDSFLYNSDIGYTLVYDRCCRSNELINIANPPTTPLAVVLEFPRADLPPITNHSPDFIVPNGLFICKNEPFNIDFSAIDKDGDELRYSLIDPLTGYSTPADPYFYDFNKATRPLAKWVSGFDKNNQIKGSSSLKIDSKTGVVSVTASSIGLYNISVLVEEFRKGKKMGSNRRDFALKVVDCATTTLSKPVIKQNSLGVTNLLLCMGTNLILEADDNPNWNFQWQKNGLNIPNENINKLTVNDKGVYTVIKSDFTNCSKEIISDKVNVVFGNTPPEIKASKPYACESEVVKIELVNNPTNVSVDWYFGDDRMNIIAPQLSITKTGRYSAKFTTPNNCPQLLSNEVQVLYGSGKPVITKFPDPNGYQICPDEPIFLETNIEHMFVFEWYKNNTILYDASANSWGVNEVGNYTLFVSNYGCEKTRLEYKVTRKANCPVEPESNLYFPRAFSPNGDGLNDIWDIYNIETFPDVEISIYNRWGEEVFYSKGYTEKWDGTFKGKKVPADNYSFVIKPNFEDKVDIKGSIVVLY